MEEGVVPVEAGWTDSCTIIVAVIVVVAMLIGMVVGCCILDIIALEC